MKERRTEYCEELDSRAKPVLSNQENLILLFMSFLDNISDFYHWMAQFDEVNARSRTNYISWLKFLSNNYVIDEGISDESINEIISSESGLLTSPHL